MYLKNGGCIDIALRLSLPEALSLRAIAAMAAHVEAAGVLRVNPQHAQPAAGPIAADLAGSERVRRHPRRRS
jgi:hypothetical protein